jgi:hypothetical protein
MDCFIARSEVPKRQSCAAAKVPSSLSLAQYSDAASAAVRFLLSFPRACLTCARNPGVSARAGKKTGIFTRQPPARMTKQTISKGLIVTILGYYQWTQWASRVVTFRRGAEGGYIDGIAYLISALYGIGGEVGFAISLATSLTSCS